DSARRKTVQLRADARPSGSHHCRWQFADRSGVEGRASRAGDDLQPDASEPRSLNAAPEKETRKPSPDLFFGMPEDATRALLTRQDGVLQLLGDPRLDDCLGWNLDRFASRRVAAHSGFAMLLDQLDHAGQHKLS